MNRAQRRAEQRAKKKQGIDQQSIEVEFIQPWSDVLMKTKLSDEVLDGMLDITEQILQDPDRKNWGDNLAGQIADEPLIPHEMMMKYKIGKGGNVFNWLMNCVGEYVKACSRQQATQTDYDKVKNVNHKKLYECGCRHAGSETRSTWTNSGIRE